jgi:hypothetical protein
MTAAIKSRFRKVARARSIPVDHLREVVAANVDVRLPAAEQDRIRRLILARVESGAIALEPLLRRRRTSRTS